jgi:hypothetical protein
MVSISVFQLNTIGGFGIETKCDPKAAIQACMGVSFDPSTYKLKIWEGKFACRYAINYVMCQNKFPESCLCQAWAWIFEYGLESWFYIVCPRLASSLSEIKDLGPASGNAHNLVFYTTFEELSDRLLCVYIFWHFNMVRDSVVVFL